MAMQASIAVRHAHDDDIIALAYDAPRKIVYCAARAPNIKAWDLKTGHGSILKAHKGPVMVLTFCEGLSTLISAGLDGYVVIWDDKGYALQVNLDGAARLVPISLNDRKRRGPKPNTSDQETLFKQMAPEMHGPAHGHTDIVSGIALAENGLLFSVSHDQTFCTFDIERPHDTFTKSVKVHTAAIISLTHDIVNNWFVTGAYDGSFQVWSSQGKLMEAFRGVSDDRTIVVYSPMTHMYWQLGRYGKLHAYDPRAPAVITPYVEESNNLADFDITGLWVQPYTDCIFGATRDRDIVIWRYSLSGAHRTFKAHQGWAEALMVVRLPLTDDQRQVLARMSASTQGAAHDTEAINEHIFTAHATGCILKWTHNREQLCELYEAESVIRIGTKTVLCLVYCPELNAIIAGGDDMYVKVHSLEKKQRFQGDMPLPDELHGHTQRVTGLAMLKDFVLASVSFDRSICFWDLHTMKEIERGRKVDAHQAPIAGIHYIPERNEIATQALENVAKVWDVTRPHDARMIFEMETPGEITQVAWIPWKERWITTSDDDCVRLWTDDGRIVYMFGYDGGSVNALYVDNHNHLLLIATQDRYIRVFDLETPIPKARYFGHTELIRGIGFIEELNCYATCSWDKTVRIWQGHYKTDALTKHHHRVLTHRDLTGAADEKVTSEYERNHPLLTPRALTVWFFHDICASISVCLDNAVYNVLCLVSEKSEKVVLGKGVRKARVKVPNHTLRKEAEVLSNQIDKLDEELLHELDSQRKPAVLSSQQAQVATSPKRRPSALTLPQDIH